MATKKKKPKDDRQIIKEHLKSKGIKQSWLADQIGISKTHLHQILNMKRELTPSNLTLIQNALNLGWSSGMGIEEWHLSDMQ